tara:strand:+ start:7 stop:522 length:516 start_codon:yes stop_codon:yes gene_type:complete
MGYKYLEKYEIIRVVPTLDTNAYGVDDVLFTGVEIPNVVREDGGCSKLMNMFVVDRADQGDIDIEFYFTEKNTSFGSQNATANISAANLKAIGFCGWALLDGANATTGNNIDNATLHRVLGNSIDDANTGIPLTFLQAESGSKSVYCHAVIRTGTPTFAADSLDLVFHIEK